MGPRCGVKDAGYQPAVRLSPLLPVAGRPEEEAMGRTKCPAEAAPPRTHTEFHHSPGETGRVCQQ